MCEEGAVKKMEVPHKLSSANAARPPRHGSNLSFVKLRKSLKEIGLFVAAAEGGAEHLAQVSPLLVLWVGLPSRFSPMSLWARLPLNNDVPPRNVLQVLQSVFFFFF